MNSETWLAVKEKSSASESCTLPAACVEQASTGLISMADTLGLPTVFLTHSAADSQWPDLARLICPEINTTVPVEARQCRLVLSPPYY